LQRGAGGIAGRSFQKVNSCPFFKRLNRYKKSFLRKRPFEGPAKILTH
jgi:hypothetical protein